MARPPHGRARRGGGVAADHGREPWKGARASQRAAARPAVPCFQPLLMDLLRRVANVPRFTLALGRAVALGGLLCLTSLSWLIATAPPAAASTPTVTVLHLDGEDNSVTADYLSSALVSAGRAGAGAVVIEINTPGGISTAMDQMVSAILNAPVPVAAYVAPTGSRAAS